MEIPIRIRGIYTTALTKLFGDQGFRIIDPSEKISERFEFKDERERVSFVEIKIRDKQDKHGVIIEGREEEVEKVIEILKAHFLDMIIRKRPTSMKKGPTFQDLFNPVVLEVEFPYISKAALDELRSKVSPTIKNHHKFRIFASSEVDRAEERLSLSSESRRDIELENLVYETYKPKMLLKIYHVKPEGEVISLAKGEIIEFNRESCLVKVRRNFKSGRYDGLNLKIEEGDYSETLIREGSWTIIHSYYSSQAKLKGILINLNTPVEFYPKYVRYVDLYIDVVKWPDGRKKIIDRKDLERAVERGYIMSDLAKEAVERARELVEND
ncbi:MAG: DUF402 domain-containing protein [bacterium]|nr:DUF402 domain-containing protein [bacterium]